jgi:ATP-dependent protease ClpP protease subunit
MDPLWEASLRHRILFLGTPIDEATVNSLIRALLLMNAEDPSAPIEIYINSAGGNILDGWPFTMPCRPFWRPSPATQSAVP